MRKVWWAFLGCYRRDSLDVYLGFYVARSKFCRKWKVRGSIACVKFWKSQPRSTTLATLGQARLIFDQPSRLARMSREKFAKNFSSEKFLARLFPRLAIFKILLRSTANFSLRQNFDRFLLARSSLSIDRKIPAHRSAHYYVRSPRRYGVRSIERSSLSSRRVGRHFAPQNDDRHKNFVNEIFACREAIASWQNFFAKRKSF